MLIYVLSSLLLLSCLLENGLMTDRNVLETYSSRRVQRVCLNGQWMVLTADQISHATVV